MNIRTVFTTNVSPNHLSYNPLDYLFFLRPALHPPVWTIVILGFYSGPFSFGHDGILLWLLLISSGVAGWAYIINQIADIESDRANNKLFFLPQGLISLKAAYIEAGLLFAATIVGSFLLGPLIGILFSLGLLMGYIYSGPPFYGKNRPLPGIFLNGLAHGMTLFIAGYIGAGGQIGEGIVRSIPYFFAVAAVFVGTTIPDIDGDRKTGKITPGVALGARRSIFLMSLFLLLAIIGSIMTGDRFLLVVSGASLPFYVWSAIHSDETGAVTALKISIAALTFAACWRFWPYGIFLVGLFIVTRLYYRHRFNMVYPRLS